MSEPAYAPPSIDPADEDTLVGTLRAVLGKFLQGVDDCLPAVVIAAPTRGRVTVRPQIMMGATDGQKVRRAQIASVPVFSYGAGDFVLSFPVKPGDLGWIKASDRDISLYLQGMAEEWPNTKRMHSFEDGFFIPDVMRNWSLNAEDAERVVLQSTDGLSRIAVGDGVVKIAAASVVIEADDVDIQSGTLTHNGVNVGSTHVHGDIQPGAGNTGVPH
jgi:hypothetical protein